MAETQYPRWIWKVSVLLVALCEVGAIPSNRAGYSSKKPLQFSNYKYENKYEDGQYEGDECGSKHLICVPKRECHYPDGACPVNFQPMPKGYCVFRSKYGVVDERTQYQVVEYCRLLGARPYFFQSPEEFNEFLYLVITGELALGSNQVYWLDAFWQTDVYRWEWRSTKQPIDWEKILNGTYCRDENMEVTLIKNGCLGFFFDFEGGKKCLKLRSLDCKDAYPFVCKMGLHNSRCAKNHDSTCCYSPTYDYLKLLSGPGSHSVHGTARSDCWIKLEYYGSSKKCEDALRIVGNLAPFPQPVLVGNSYLYFSEGKCPGERLAVVSSRAVHDFIFRYLLTVELLIEQYKYVLGLRYDEKEDQFYWENGKIITYYSDTKGEKTQVGYGYDGDDGLLFWAPGQPDKTSGVDSKSCVAYRKVGRNDYKWYLIPAVGCSDKYVVNVCELPIRSTRAVPSVKKGRCGQRRELGVLARSYAPRGHYDQEFNEAQYGEFGWHVAVMKTSNVQHGVAVRFACSGALIHEEFVLTSAHCVESVDGVFQVSLGAHDLKKDASHILDSKLVKVIDVIIHPGYDSKTAVHDLALLHLETKVVTSAVVGLACLPFPKLFYQSTGHWDCLVVGWPPEPRKGDWILQRIESEFIRRRYCHDYVRRSYPPTRHNSYLSEGYDKQYGFHHANYERHQYFSTSDPDLLCTEPYETNACLDEPTPILVCRKPYVSAHDSLLPDGHSGYHHGSLSDEIVNAYGDDRFNSEEWYVMGVGHRLTSCENYYADHRRRYGRDIQVFTPVNEHLTFIHSHLDQYEDQYEEPYEQKY